MQVLGADRGFSRPALTAVLAGVLTVGAVAASRLGSSPEVERGPVAVPNADAQPAVERTVAGVRYLEAGEAQERLVLDSVPPTRQSRLLFFQGLPLQPLPEHASVGPDGARGLLWFDGDLRVHRVRARLAGRVPVSAASGGEDKLWIATETGEIVAVDESGMIVDSLRGPFDYSQVYSDAAGQEIWLARSNQNWSYRLSQVSDPLLARLDSSSDLPETIGGIRVPEHVLLAELANAGHLAVSEEVVYYAPFIRDEVIAMSKRGDTLWVATRGLPQSVEEPKFVIENGEPLIDYAPVNLGAALGPDGRLYVLSTPGFTTQRVRLDVFDAAMGHLSRSVLVDVPDPTIAVDDEGRAYILDPFRLMTGVAPAEREEFRAFDLPTLDGGQMTLADLGGKVALLNFWASWCAPCRAEMPALDSLRHSITNQEFVFVAMNDDVTERDARQFIEEHGFEFPVVLGGGKLSNRYHYIGLPFTVLLDRSGRVVQRWIGYAGEVQLQGIRTVAEAELMREGKGGGHQHSGSMMEHEGHGEQPPGSEGGHGHDVGH
jgi:thiol-disulfide isomerase/thioredoxin